MMISEKLQEAFNKQINVEQYSSQLYLSMAAYFESQDLKGMASWMLVQATEENAHAMRIFNFLNDRSGRVVLEKLEAPKTEWASPLDVFEDAYKHELHITGQINNLMNVAGAERDGASHDFLEWFCREQIEEESSVQLIVSQLKLVGDSGVGRYMIDQQLGQRGAGK
jgi:ferritin